MARKTISLPAATAPTAPRYAAGKPPVPPELQTAPRADGSMGTGKSGGNYVQADVSIGAGSSKVQQGIDSSDPTA